VTPHARSLNALTKEAGVTWHECHGCGRDWPFPAGAKKAAENREWRCHGCVNADWARLQRAKRNVLAFVRAIGTVSMDEAIAAINKEWGGPNG
jgi:hypothetical protein